MEVRLQKILDELGIKQTTLARELNVSEGTVRGLLSGRVKTISGEMLVALQERYQVNPLWLVKGEGSMLLSDKEAAPSRPRLVEPVITELPADPQLIAKALAELPKEDIETAASYVSWLAAKSRVDVSKIKEPHAKYLTKSKSEYTDVPLLGSIAAGNPILAEENIETVVRVPQSVISSKGRRLFALRIRGVSMIGAGIEDGDYALLREVISPRDEVSPGQIVAAVIGNEATLKRVYLEDHSVVLKAENPMFEPIVCHDWENCRIVGRLVLTWRWWETK